MNERYDSEGAKRESAPASPSAEHGADERVALRIDDRHRRRRALLAGGVGLAVLIGVTAGGVAYAGSIEPASTSATTTVFPGGSRGGFGGGTAVSPFAGGGMPAPRGSGSASQATTATPATTAQISGVVTITSDLTYQDARSAGTGIVLTSDGMILTNNHVVEGATSISVTVESTGRSFTARVVGTDKTQDIAVLQLENASGLTPASLDTDGTSVGDAVTAVGNAEGTGDLVSAPGTITALRQQITTQPESGISSESLVGLIQVDADIVPGDSGGPLLDSDGRVVGIDTAASSGSADVAGFAIPISTALDIVATIEAGADTATVEIGYPAFLGVALSAHADALPGRGTPSASGGAAIGGVIEGTPAAEAGLVAGDTVTSLDGAAVSSSDQLSAALAKREPGESVSLTWTDAEGASHSATVTLADGPVS